MTSRDIPGSGSTVVSVGTGLIVAFVVTVWAAYFVPLALRRYDEAHAQSALELLSPLSRVIRRSQGVETAVSGADADEADEPDEVDDAVDEIPQKPSAVRASRSGLTRASARLAARRRRRVLFVLLAALAIVSTVAALSYLPLWSIAIPATLLIAWLVACRIQVRSEYGHAPVAPLSLPKIPAVAKRVKRSSAAESEDTVIVVPDLGDASDIDPERRHIMEDVPLEPDALDEELAIAVPSAGSHGEMVWDPLPVTLPTYVTKPRAGRTVRTIDFDAPGAWTSGHVEGEQTELPAAEQAVADGQQRAAGE